ncbi:MAG: bifunctional demethylmenaquinone methyltransferase/2-methoxy-6-polyprenyl-1,4-benzoquinol methylase UbiE [Muribaculaceae bacterium]|nr:bifunctional demethylmenaquinone methyltransferase/2-methoxy-6-polyprenyl-1,4-benzoquinol methylase UbiE [Muribaculaceae bacterium]
MDVEKITPYGDERDKGSQVEEMFDSIAPSYDFMNRAMTMGIDKLWRRKAVRTLTRLVPPPCAIVDIATGTGDLAISLARALPEASVLGVDLSEGMLAVGRRKVAEAGLEERIRFRRGDGLALPVESDSADAVTIAYGIRNFADIPGGYREMLRVLRPGGVLAVLELSTPTQPVPAALYRLYTRTLIPLAGRIVSKDARAYTYLPESIAAVAQGERMTRIMSEAGFERCSFRPMTFGACTLYTAFKPEKN